MDIARGRDPRPAVLLGECERELACGRVQDRARVDDPIVPGRIAVEVRRICQDAGRIRKRVLLRSVNRTCSQYMPKPTGRSIVGESGTACAPQQRETQICSGHHT